jgi:hypothetical protein
MIVCFFTPLASMIYMLHLTTSSSNNHQVFKYLVRHTTSWLIKRWYVGLLRAPNKGD